MSERRSNTIPNRWLNCPRTSENIIGNQFLAFKTPLSSQYDSEVPEYNRFKPNMVFECVKTLKRKISLWIDLTNTSRFYDKKEVEQHGCRYNKIKLRGHKETPSEEQTQHFIDIVRESMDKNPDDLIGVHCTHGFNRTGFLIIAYLVLENNCSLHAAIFEFSRNRPPGIYKQDYLDELFRRYDDIEDVIAAPARPDWCIEEDDEEEVIEEEAGNDEEGHRSKHSYKKHLKDKEFIPKVNGVTLVKDPEVIKIVRSKAKTFCKWKNNDFPGSQPVSMDLENMKKLSEKPYSVSWKADGVRYMMLIDGDDKVYLLDRDNCVFKASNLHFFHNKTHEPLKDTFLDGEMVVDTVKGVIKVRYLCYDIIRFENINVGKEPFYTVRLKCIDNEIIKPRERAIESGRIDKNSEPFRVGIKHFWDVTITKQLLEDKFIKTLTHEPDGLIFQPAVDPYVAGPCESVLKWKPSDMNSIDFKLKIVKEDRPGMIPRLRGQLYVGQGVLFNDIKVTSAIRNLDGKIIECKYENKKWVFMRERNDKSFPNSLNTAKAVAKSILSPVTKERLLQYIKEHCVFNDPKKKRARYH
ncbi:mRNA-capping enzyme [Vanessa atalanta]|uniref:mRNA-capping enzyme n=1 Tax=Vanessa atalanta TaxID=42275 RepID=UPI001FCD8A09|nr:mRNA-capping enzyme [Vanessa atalanta]